MTEQLVYRILLISIFITATIVFISLYIVTAPYGRHFRKGWGPTIHARIGWVVMEFPAILVITLTFFLGDRKTNLIAIIFLAMWLLHYAQRTFIYPLLMKGGNKRFPISLISFAILFNIVNGYINGRYIFFFSPVYSISWIIDPRFIIGILIFFTGLTINIYSDYILRQLRKTGERDYKIPYRGLFKYISSPNYFGEIIEWLGWAIATWSLPGLAFAVFTAANLMPRAFSNHKWYIKKFTNYPKQRKALIPFIY